MFYICLLFYQKLTLIMEKFANDVIEDRKIRCALVGCGRIFEKHLEALKAHAEDLLLVGVCDIDPAKLATAVASSGVRGFPNLDALLVESDADIVVLCTPSGLHAEQTVSIANAGRHVITEKPMATRWEDGKRMLQACDNAGVRLFVVKQNRSNSTLQMLKSAVKKGRFGRIYLVNVNVFWSRSQEYYESAPWRGTWEFDGGAFMNQASHYVDLLDWIVGPVESLQSYTATLARNIEVEDTGVVSIKWRSGALGSMNVTMLTYPKNLEGSITIIGENGTARVGGIAVNQISHWEFKEPDLLDQAVRDASYETTSVYGFGHQLYYQNVIDVMRGKVEPDTDGREGLRSLELLISIYLSARDGRRVSLPLEY